MNSIFAIVLFASLAAVAMSGVIAPGYAGHLGYAGHHLGLHAPLAVARPIVHAPLIKPVHHIAPAVYGHGLHAPLHAGVYGHGLHHAGVYGHHGLIGGYGHPGVYGHGAYGHHAGLLH